MKNDIITKVALDIGNHSIKILLGEISSDWNRISVVDYVKVRSRGLKKSNIEDSEALYESLKEGFDKLYEKTGYDVEKISLAIGGSGAISSRIDVKLSFPEKEITEEDIDNLYKQAEKKIFGAKENGYYRILYREMFNIRTSDVSGVVKSPIGKICKSLSASIHLVYVDESYLEKFTEIINKLGLEVENVYLNSYVSALGTLNEESKNMGVAHIDIGYSTTDLIMIKYSKVIYSKTLALGEIHYISDLSYGLEITKEEAAEVIRKFKNKEFEKDNTIKCVTRNSIKKISLRDIRDIIQQRTNDIINFIITTINESGFNSYLSKGIVLTGGVVSMDGVSELIASKSGYLVRKEKPIEIKGLLNPFYSEAIVIGIFLQEVAKGSIEYEKEMSKRSEEDKTNEEETKENIFEDKELDEIMDEVEDDKEGTWDKVVKFLKDFF